MNLELSWSMKRDGGDLVVHYDVKNSGAAPVWLVDDLLVWGGKAFEKAPDAIVVRRGDQPGTVNLLRGHLYIPSREMRHYPTAGVREVPAGGSVSGEARRPMPLQAWHNFHPKKMDALDGAPERAVLELQVLPAAGDPDKDYTSITLQDGSSLTVPHQRFLDQTAESLVSDPKPIP